jgi:hypothetical protein
MDGRRCGASFFGVITAGLNDGDRVVTDGQYKPQVDVPVAIIAAPQTAENAK